MNLFREGKELFERTTTLKVIRRPDFPFISLRKRYLKVRLDFTKGCNLRCVMCPSVAMGDFEIREMETELFDKIAGEVLPRTEHLTIGCGAEPLIAKNFDRYVRTIASRGIPYTLIISNGSLLTERKIQTMLEACVDELSVSIESADKQEYESIRVGARFDKLVENLHLLNELKKKQDAQRPALSFNTVLMKSNVAGLVSLIEFAHKMGATSFCMTHLTPYAGLDNERESLFYHQELANKELTQAREVAESLGIRLFSPPLFIHNGQDDSRPTEKGVRGMPCVQPWTFMVINCDGEVSPCGWLYGEMPAGSFRTQSFREIWFGDLYRNLRREIRTGNLRPRCARCPAAGLGDPNRRESFEQVYL